MNVEALIGSLGFPIAVAVYLLWCLRDERRECGKRLDRMQEQIDRSCRCCPNCRPPAYTGPPRAFRPDEPE